MAFCFVAFSYGAVIFYSASVGRKPYFPDRPSSSALSRFAAHIPQNAVVYWPDHIVRTWYYLGRLSYYSRSQSAGACFSRASTMEMKRRADRVAAVARIDGVWPSYGKFLPKHTDPEMYKGLLYACGDPKLDYVVLEQHFPALSHVSWSDTSEHKTWWLYDCGKIRHNLK